MDSTHALGIGIRSWVRRRPAAGEAQDSSTGVADGAIVVRSAIGLQIGHTEIDHLLPRRGCRVRCPPDRSFVQRPVQPVDGSEDEFVLAVLIDFQYRSP
jgi:hypothetical protein